MPSSKPSNTSTSRLSAPKPPAIRSRQGLPWLTIAATLVVILLAGAVAWVVIDKSKQNSALQSWAPTAENHDPSTAIPGIFVAAATDENTTNPMDGTPLLRFTYPAYKALIHVSAGQRVAYDRFPPVGGPHDGQWAHCEGVVYTKAVRDENMVHTLEHGAIWIAYNPDTVTGAALDKLKSYVQGSNYISMAPYPGLKKNISLQAWAHQLQVDDANDPRIAQFITALRQNIYVYPETGARCDSPGWDDANPPAFDATPRDATAIPMSGEGAGGSATDSGMATGSAENSAVESGQPAVSSSDTGAATSGAVGSTPVTSGASTSAGPASGAGTSGAVTSPPATPRSSG